MSDQFCLFVRLHVHVFRYGKERGLLAESSSVDLSKLYLLTGGDIGMYQDYTCVHVHVHVYSLSFLSLSLFFLPSLSPSLFVVLLIHKIKSTINCSYANSLVLLSIQ